MRTVPYALSAVLLLATACGGGGKQGAAPAAAIQAPIQVTVTVNPNVADTVNITVAEYRIGQQRLTVNATSSIVDGTPALTLMGYGVNGAGVQMTYQGNGLYIVILSGVSQPATVTVNSSFGGTRTSALTKLRQ